MDRLALRGKLSSRGYFASGTFMNAEKTLESLMSSGKIRSGVKYTISTKHLDLSSVRSVPQYHISHKPTGLWYGIGSSWINFVLREQMLGGEEKIYVYEVAVAPGKLLVLDTEQKVLDFTQEYGAVDVHSDDDEATEQIRWDKVGSHYGGIEIAPYQDELRMDQRTGWYYSWDVASGCIWGSGVVTGLKLVE